MATSVALLSIHNRVREHASSTRQVGCDGWRCRNTPRLSIEGIMVITCCKFRGTANGI